MITERTLRRWRKESLHKYENLHTQPLEKMQTFGELKELHSRILRMTQELLDAHLMRREDR